MKKVYKHGESRPAAEFEDQNACSGEHVCPFEPWMPRLRWLLHCFTTEQNGKLSERLEKAFTDILNDQKVDDPMAVANACFELQRKAWENMKRFIEHDMYKPKVH